MRGVHQQDGGRGADRRRLRADGGAGGRGESAGPIAIVGAGRDVAVAWPEAPRRRPARLRSRVFTEAPCADVRPRRDPGVGRHSFGPGLVLEHESRAAASGWWPVAPARPSRRERVPAPGGDGCRDGTRAGGGARAPDVAGARRADRGLLRRGHRWSRLARPSGGIRRRGRCGHSTAPRGRSKRWRWSSGPRGARGADRARLRARPRARAGPETGARPRGLPAAARTRPNRLLSYADDHELRRAAGGRLCWTSSRAGGSPAARELGRRPGCTGCCSACSPLTPRRCAASTRTRSRRVVRYDDHYHTDLLATLEAYLAQRLQHERDRARDLRAPAHGRLPPASA